MGLLNGKMDDSEVRDAVHDLRRMARDIGSAAIVAANTYQEHVRLMRERADVNEGLMLDELPSDIRAGIEAKAAQDNKSVHTLSAEDGKMVVRFNGEIIGTFDLEVQTISADANNRLTIGSDGGLYLGDAAERRDGAEHRKAMLEGLAWLRDGMAEEAQPMQLDPGQVLDAYHRLTVGYGDTTRANCIEAMRQALAGHKA